MKQKPDRLQRAVWLKRKYTAPYKSLCYGESLYQCEQDVAELERNPNWTVVAQYIDEGITGTQMKKRPSFMQILKDVAELESAKREGPVAKRAYKALYRSYDTKVDQGKALPAKLRK